MYDAQSGKRVDVRALLPGRQSLRHEARRSRVQAYRSGVWWTRPTAFMAASAIASNRLFVANFWKDAERVRQTSLSRLSVPAHCGLSLA